MVKIKKNFTVSNIKCGGCAKTVKKALASEYGEVFVDLDVHPRVISLRVSEDFNEKDFRKKMKSLGYPFVDENLGGFEKVGVKAKSFVSCAIGKMDSQS